jgi:hypothetical protein
MAIVAISMVAIISMAALSIDLGTLYEARAEAQRAADAAALAAARVISLEGITGDPTLGPSDGSWTDICGGAGSPASLAAINVAQQNLIGGAPAPAANINVYYGTSSGVGTSTTCTGAGLGFTVNPIVQVKVRQPNLPTFFARVFSLIFKGTSVNSGVSATATAEVFNSSGSGSVASGMIPVQPRCVKPWIIPNQDPDYAANPFITASTGVIFDPGIYQLSGPGAGVIGESFDITANCKAGASDCEIADGNMAPNPPIANAPAKKTYYLPALISGTPVAVPSGSSCSISAGYQSAIAGCDQSTVYTCGTPSTGAGATQADLIENPLNPAGISGDSPSATMCLINQLTGQDTLAGYPTAVTYPFQIQAGFGNPLVQAGVVNSNYVITSSNNIVTLPIADFGTTLLTGNTPAVSIVGFLQVFINTVNPDGSMNVTVMNIDGCGNNAAGNSTVTGTSPVPIRLITSP